MVTNKQSGTNVHEVADGIYRINTSITIEGGPGGFSFNQYLVVDDEPLIFHTGPRKMFPLVREAVESVLPVERLRYIAFSHVESDECGSLNEWLAVAPDSSPVCGTVAAQVSISDLTERPPRPLADGETLSLGTHFLRWFDTPHLPHSWDLRLPHGGEYADAPLWRFVYARRCSQPGRHGVGYPRAERSIPPGDGLLFAHNECGGDDRETLACAAPTTLACMHGSAWRGDGAALLRAISDSLSR